MATSNDGSSFGEEREAPEATPATDQIAALAKILAPLAANMEASTAQYRRHLFSIERVIDAAPARAEDQDVNDDDMAQTLGGLDAQTINELDALKKSVLDINSKIHNVTTSAPQIERVLAESLRTPFTEKITNVRLRRMEKLRLPTFDGVSDPFAHVTSFNIAMRRANLSGEEKDADFCQLFVETLEGIALNWFNGL